MKPARPHDGFADARTAPPQEDRFRSLVELVPLVTYIDALDDTATTLYISPQVEQLLGYALAEWREDPDLWARLLHPEDRAAVLAENAYHNRTGEPFRMEYRLIARDGSIVWVLDEAVIERDERGVPLSSRGYMLDITERKALEEQLTHQAFHDPLTGLPNRALFRDRADHAFERRVRDDTPLAVLFLDLDEFKTVNDSLGHGAGDELLAQASARIRTCLRRGDTAARLGGDEFGILVEGCPEEEVATLAARIGAALAEPFRTGHREVFVTASVGIAFADGGEASGEELLRNADVAMYRAKAAGKGRTERYEPAMHREVLERLELTSELQRALAREELVLHYQPIVDLATRAVVGVEALVRWQHPTRGLIAPTGFISLAEQTGVIVPLGRWVLDRACESAARWQRALGEQAPFVSVNVSLRDLQERDVVEAVGAALASHRLAPGKLVLEITESVLMSDPGLMASRLRAIGALGVRLAIDDFGTGYSSLSYLRELPVDIVKIAKPFVDGLGRAADEDRFARAVLRIGDALSLKTIAEGVEAEAHSDALRALRCDMAQGFHYARPLDAGAIEALLLGRGELAA